MTLDLENGNGGEPEIRLRDRPALRPDALRNRSLKSGAPLPRDRGDNRSEEEILLASQNREYQRPCLIVFDWRDVKGSSPQGPAFVFKGLAPGSENLHILFPRTAVDEIKKPDISLWKVGVLPNERIQVASAPSEIFFELDFSGGFLSVILSHSYELQYNEFVKQGVFKLPYDDSRIRRELEAGLHYYDGAAKTWISRRAKANTW